MLDTNCDPAGIDYVIPSNDDAIRAIKLITSKIAEAAVEGGQVHAEKQAAAKEEQEKRAAEATKAADAHKASHAGDDEGGEPAAAAPETEEPAAAAAETETTGETAETPEEEQK
jgi:small subunit ribosomal protein S2